LREPVRKMIDGEDYTFCLLPPRQSVRLLTKIMKIIGPALGTIVEGNDLSNLDSVQDIDFDLSKAVSALFDHVNEDDVDMIIDALISQVIHKGTGDLSKSFDYHFQGRLPHLFKVIGAALEVQYGDFFAGKLGDLKGKLRAAIPQGLQM